MIHCDISLHHEFEGEEQFHIDIEHITTLEGVEPYVLLQVKSDFHIDVSHFMTPAQFIDFREKMRAALDSVEVPE